MAAKTAKKDLKGMKVRKLDGKTVKPTLFNGKAAGQGKYLSGEVDGIIVVDQNGRPIPFRSIGSMEVL
jgi:hypothetical protein